jgi:hypothetical protein
MSIPRKKSRPIRVEGKKYRWMVSSGRAFDKRLTIESISARKFLQVGLRPRAVCDENGDRAYWDGDEPPKATLTPLEVKAIIVEAVRQGWPEGGDLRGFKPQADLADFLAI